MPPRRNCLALGRQLSRRHRRPAAGRRCHRRTRMSTLPAPLHPIRPCTSAPDDGIVVEDDARSRRWRGGARRGGEAWTLKIGTSVSMDARGAPTKCGSDGMSYRRSPTCSAGCSRATTWSARICWRFFSRISERGGRSDSEIRRSGGRRSKSCAGDLGVRAADAHCGRAPAASIVPRRYNQTVPDTDETRMSPTAEGRAAWAERLAAWRRYEAWECRAGTPRTACELLVATTWLYDLLPEESRSRPIDPSGVARMRACLSVLGRSR